MSTYSIDGFEDDADAEFELNLLRTEEEKALLEGNLMLNLKSLELDDDYNVQDKLLQVN